MGQKPIKRNEHIVKLSREHHFSLLFCWKIRQGLKKEVAPARISRYIQFFWSRVLALHFREEEEILFAPLPDDELVLQAIKEHQQIQEQIERLDNGEQDPAPQLLSLLADSVDEHVRFEERTLFPHIENKLNEAQLEAIGKKLDSVPQLPDDNYEDEFWTKN